MVVLNVVAKSQDDKHFNGVQKCDIRKECYSIESVVNLEDLQFIW